MPDDYYSDTRNRNEPVNPPAGQTWIDVWSRNFYRFSDGQAWIDELNGQWKLNTNPTELLHVVKDMTENKDTPAKPTLRDLKFAIRRRRHAWQQNQNERHEQTTSGSVGCTLCFGSGVLEFSLTESWEVRVPIWRDGGEGRYSAPCRCAAGQSMRRAHWQAFQGINDKMARSVVDRYDEIRKGEECV